MPPLNQKHHNRLKSDYKRRVRGELKQRLIEYIKTHPCVDCGEDDYIVIDFDHVRGKKKKAISSLINACRPWKEIRAELKKCDSRCANCHRRSTADKLGFWKQL